MKLQASLVKPHGVTNKTAGGVFLHLLKKKIEKETVKKIFLVEKRKQKDKRELMKGMRSLMSGEAKKSKP